MNGRDGNHVAIRKVDLVRHTLNVLFCILIPSLLPSLLSWCSCIVGVRIIFRVAFRQMFGRSLFRLNGDKTALAIRLCILLDYVRTTSQRDDDVYSMRYAKTTSILSVYHRTSTSISTRHETEL